MLPNSVLQWMWITTTHMTDERTQKESQTQSADYAKQPWIVSVGRMLGNWCVIVSTIPFL